MKPGKTLKWSRGAILLGGMVWIVGGVVLALRPGGDPPASFRNTIDVMPLLGVGLLLIGGPLGLQALGLRHRGERLFSVAAACLLTGAIFYPLGAGVRYVFLKGAWEPMMPIGFLLVVAGCLLYGIISLRTGLHSKAASILLIGCALSLFGFNDQYTPGVGTVFGVIVTAFVCAGELRSRKPGSIQAFLPPFKNKP